VATILLMTPAALHRISFGGEESPMFFRMASAFVTAAPAPLALGIVGDLYVAVSKAVDSPILALIAAGVMFMTLTTLWYLLPYSLRIRQAH
jgi:hypothetical protein